jgi:hypothetical protein
MQVFNHSVEFGTRSHETSIPDNKDRVWWVHCHAYPLDIDWEGDDPSDCIHHLIWGALYDLRIWDRWDSRYPQNTPFKVMDCAPGAIWRLKMSLPEPWWQLIDISVNNLPFEPQFYYSKYNLQALQKEKPHWF